MSNKMIGPEKPDEQEVQRAILWLKEKGALSLYHKKELKTDDGDTSASSFPSLQLCAD
ncbi:hypothetical protein RvY_12931 [Ramazzottius varieornatus]|uniref:Uncharacterized protein n=1 Tax=Ramazzottius varieornatus TaxID=947166 RepID=A0A1D1VTQ6_RAMVA|nr:hypothetical protein RvY_12931 [Ramazzottius varieornatus]